jgi:hypothetical protein
MVHRHRTTSCVFPPDDGPKSVFGVGGCDKGHVACCHVTLARQRANIHYCIFMTPDDTRQLATFLLNATTIALRAQCPIYPTRNQSSVISNE